MEKCKLEGTLPRLQTIHPPLRIRILFFWLPMVIGLALGPAESLAQGRAPKLEGNTYLSLLTGANLMQNQFIELGLAKNKLNRIGNSMFGYNYFVSAEISTKNSGLWGPKIGFWVTNGLGLGMNMIYYMEGDKNRFCFRPEAGLGLARFKVAYGYNLTFGKSGLGGINEHNVCVQYLFNLKTLKNEGNPDEM